MKTTKIIIASILVFMLVFALCACGESENSSAETQTAATEAPDYTGAYTSFAYASEDLGMGDYLISSEAMGGTMTFTLNDDGTGTTAMNDDEHEITWKADGEKLTLTTKDGNDISGTVKDGVMIIVMESDGMTGEVYLAKPDADTSSYKVLTLEEAMAMKIAELATE